jgi:hypothetical protein
LLTGAYRDQVTRRAAIGDRQVEGPYRCVRLNAWLDVIYATAYALNEPAYQVADGSCGRSSSGRSCHLEK